MAVQTVDEGLAEGCAEGNSVTGHRTNLMTWQIRNHLGEGKSMGGVFKP